MTDDPVAILREAENALTDYIERIEKTGASLNYGRSVLMRIRRYLTYVETRPDTGSRPQR